MRLAGEYIVRHSQPNGQFVYWINTNPDVTMAEAYNMVRHAGAMYSLAGYHQLHPTKQSLRVLEHANSFLKSQVKELTDVPHTLAVWSDGNINHSQEPLSAKLGGTGLGLAAMSELEKILPGLTPKLQLEGLGNFLLFMQRDDGGFYSTYYPIFPGRDDSWTSLYYPGEAALGLLLLNDVLPNKEWVRGAREALLFLARERQGQDQIPADHWALIATEKLLSDASFTTEEDRVLLRTHAKQVVRLILSERSTQQDNLNLDGCFTSDGRTTPTATRLEGLIAASRVISNQDAIHPEMKDSIQRGIQFLMRSQIKVGAHAGGIPRAIARLPEGDPSWSQNFNLRATEIRIDYVQHALSAFMGYRRVLGETAGAAK